MIVVLVTKIFISDPMKDQGKVDSESFIEIT